MADLTEKGREIIEWAQARDVEDGVDAETIRSERYVAVHAALNNVFDLRQQETTLTLVSAQESVAQCIKFGQLLGRLPNVSHPAQEAIPLPAQSLVFLYGSSNQDSLISDAIKTSGIPNGARTLNALRREGHYRGFPPDSGVGIPALHKQGCTLPEGFQGAASYKDMPSEITRIAGFGEKSAQALREIASYLMTLSGTPRPELQARD